VPSKLEGMVRILRLPLPEVPDLPVRVQLDVNDETKVLDLVMHEYDAIRGELDTSLSAQVSIMSFGAATVGLLVAAAGTLWTAEPLLAGLLLLFVVPGSCFLALAIHAGEMVRLMRAGLFLNHLENCVNRALWRSRRDEGVGVLTWEQWGIRQGGADMARHNRRAIVLVFSILAFGSMLAGYWLLHQLPEREIPEELAIALLIASSVLGVQALRWVWHLQKYAYKHRAKYERTALPPRRAQTISIRIPDVDLLAQLRAAGNTIDKEQMQEGIGQVAWLSHPDGLHIELLVPLPTDAAEPSSSGPYPEGPSWPGPTQPQR
jgi:hypothetical protein